MDRNPGKHPTEFYGYPYFDESKEAEQTYEEEEECPFLDTRCKKRRKSDNDITIGTCSVGYRKRGESEYRPHVICPHRFEVDGIFDKVEPLFIETGELFRVPEISLLGTSIDYVMGKRTNSGDVLDFAGIEIQALDTTGKVWAHKMAYENDEDMENVDNSYGINWAMSITKTMMQQAYKKGQAFEEWDENLIFLIQDVSLEYLRQNANTSRLNKATEDDPVHFYSYSFNLKDGSYEWTLNEKLSTNLRGVSQMMDSAEEDVPPTRDEFCDNIRRKF